MWRGLLFDNYDSTGTAAGIGEQASAPSIHRHTHGIHAQHGCRILLCFTPDCASHGTGGRINARIGAGPRTPGRAQPWSPLRTAQRSMSLEIGEDVVVARRAALGQRMTMRTTTTMGHGWVHRARVTKKRCEIVFLYFFYSSEGHFCRTLFCLRLSLSLS